jgi:hypothetical protein
MEDQKMNRIGILCLMFIIMISTSAFGQPVGPSEEMMRSAYKQSLSQADANEDGKLSVSECQAIYKDPAMAEKNCKFWDADNDGIITEDEYVTQIMKMGK